MSKAITLQEKIAANLFKPADEAALYLTRDEQEIRKRWAAIYTKWLDEPLTPVKDMVAFIVNGGEMSAFSSVTKATAYRDIDAVRVLLGDVKTAHKSWVRHLVYENLVWAMKTAKDKKNVDGVVLAADKLGKYFKLDKDEMEPMDWEAFPQPNFEPTDDITVLGIPGENKKDYEARRATIRKRLKMPAVDVDYTEVKKDE